MDYFNYKGDHIYAEDVDVQSIAQKHGTPCFIYSKATLARHYHVFSQALSDSPHLICYAVKANSNLALLQCLGHWGAGFDVVSQGELMRVLKATSNPSKVIYSGVGKKWDEMAFALQQGIKCFNVESKSELEKLNQLAQHLNLKAPVALRVNPDVNPKTHPYISTGLSENKFGIEYDKALGLYEWAHQQPHLDIKGVACHIGSQITELSPFIDALVRIEQLIDQLKAQNITLKSLDLGGGLGVRYHQESPPSPAEYAQTIAQNRRHHDLELILEPGRALVANAGILVASVITLKQNTEKNFCIVDCGMNDLLRPALYEAYQEIIEVSKMPLPQKSYDIVGPICETGDYLGKNRKLRVDESSLLAIRGAGAYGFSMSSNYNTRARACEILVDGQAVHLIRQRESLEDCFAHESLLPADQC